MNQFTRMALVATCIAAGPCWPAFGQGPAPVPAPMAPQPLLAANLGVVYIPIGFQDGTMGLRLTRPPLPGSPASQLPLDAGDIIFALDGQRFANPGDVASHFDQTTVDFVAARTNTLHRGNIMLPSANGVPQPPANPLQPTPGGQPNAPMVMNGVNQWGQQNMGAGPMSAQPGIAQGGPRPMTARNLGIVYVPIQLGDGTIGLRLARAPLPGSPASQLPLDTGDIILALDGQRFTNPGDVANHFDQTTVDFINAATNTVQRGNITLPSASDTGRTPPRYAPAPMAMNGTNQFGQLANAGNGPQPGPQPSAGGPGSLVAANLGVVYVPIRFGDGTVGLKLTRAPLPGSPASQLPLDAGDIIFALDGQRFTNPGDVANHFDQTTVDFIDAGTNTQQNGSITLPSQGP